MNKQFSTDNIEGAKKPPISDTGSLCLVTLLAYHGTNIGHDQLIHQYADKDGKMDAIAIVRAARQAGLKGKVVTTKLKKLKKLPLPCIAKLEDETFVIVAKIANDRVLIHKPGGSPEDLLLKDFEASWSGQLVLGAKRAKSIAEDLKFGLRWFLPVMAKYKRLFTEVLVASFFIQLLGLITPLFFQVIIDKVLVHKGITTLDVLIIGLLGLIIFDSLLNYLRTFIFSHTTSRVDVQLGSQLYRHLLALPISYFESRATGQTVARVRELDSVREFLTSSALTVLLDLFFSFVFFGVMWLFSPALTMIVLASIPAYVILSIAITPTLRKRVEEQFQRGAVNQSFLVESVSGVETLKAMAVEPQMRNRWDENLAAFVQSSFKTVTLGAAGSQLVQMINKLTMAIVLWQGAKLVMAGQLTIGQLVAFNMLAGQVAQPVIRIAQLWQDFQQFRISINRLGDILNIKPEMNPTALPDKLPALKGGISLQNITFRYRAGEKTILDDVSLEIKAGQTIGIVGRSGSGKSTITKIVQRMHVPEKGRVLLDGIDISLLDPSWLRRQIGVVLQDNILFNRTVRENIALSNPSMPMDRIMRAAQLSGAHEFILELPMGYDTVLEERGSNLSGGQRQRLAIARALAMTPNILILDEATAALDYESERHFQNNLKLVAKGRTVIIVAHRLSTVRHADIILAMDKGKIVESGTHDQLIKQGGLYASLAKMDAGQ